MAEPERGLDDEPVAIPRIAIMLASYGRSSRQGDLTCGECTHLDRGRNGIARCRLMTRGGSRWSPTWPACGRFDLRPPAPPPKKRATTFVAREDV